MDENLIKDFVHYDMNEEIRAIGGGYTLIKEERLPMGGREVLFVIGHAVFDTSCCGTGGCGYAIVPGFIEEWKHKKNASGRFVSRVKPIKDAELQKEIRLIIKQKEMVQEVRFE